MRVYRAPVLLVLLCLFSANEAAQLSVNVHYPAAKVEQSIVVALNKFVDFSCRPAVCTFAGLAWVLIGGKALP